MNLQRFNFSESGLWNSIFQSFEKNLFESDHLSGQLVPTFHHDAVSPFADATQNNVVVHIGSKFKLISTFSSN
jgi:hypothetical protein